jgi:hypothetical protein
LDLPFLPQEAFLTHLFDIPLHHAVILSALAF